jgi:hypothetical protein
VGADYLKRVLDADTRKSASLNISRIAVRVAGGS